MQNKFDNTNFEVDIEQAKKYAFRVRLREVFTDGLFTQLKWNVLFLLCCLPIVTIGPAVAALLNCTNLMVADDRPQIKASRWFFVSFKAALKKTMGFGVLFTAANFAFIFGFAFYLKMTSTSVMYVPMASVSLLAIVCIWGVSVHLFPLMFKETDFENGTVTMSNESITELVKQAAALALLNMKKTLIAVVFGLVVVAAQLLFIPASTPVVLTLGFALPAQAAALAHTEPEILDM